MAAVHTCHSDTAAELVGSSTSVLSIARIVFAVRPIMVGGRGRRIVRARLGIPVRVEVDRRSAQGRVMFGRYSGSSHISFAQNKISRRSKGGSQGAEIRATSVYSVRADSEKTLPRRCLLGTAPRRRKQYRWVHLQGQCQGAKGLAVQGENLASDAQVVLPTIPHRRLALSSTAEHVCQLGWVCPSSAV